MQLNGLVQGLSQHVAAEIDILVAAIKEFGDTINEEKYSHSIRFGLIYEKTQETLEALNGTLRAAKKQNVVFFTKQMLLKGNDDNEIIFLFKKE